MTKKKIALVFFLLSLSIIILASLIALNIIFDDTIYTSKDWDVFVDYNKAFGRINIAYGSNEDNNDVGGFIYNDYYKKLHNDVGTEYIRVWLSAQWYKPSTFPLLKDESYDFSNTDLLIDATLETGAIPFVVFAHYTLCGSIEEFDFSRCEGHGSPPPQDYNKFADYVLEVIRHFNSKYDISEWYFEIWNEPYGEEWWESEPSEYSQMFNIVYSKVKAEFPESKIGGYTGTYFRGNNYNHRAEDFVKNTNADFISIHHYGNSKPARTDKTRMNNIKPLLYEGVIDLKSFAASYGKHDIEIINSEYNSDFSAEYAKKLDEPFTAAWYASALINQIKSQVVDIEIFYSGTSSLESGGYGMWNERGKLFPTYYMKKNFVDYNTKGSSIFHSSFDENLIDVLAVENENGRFITLVNKMDFDTTISLKIDGNFREALDSGKKLTISDNEISIFLEPYEVRFIQII